MLPLIPIILQFLPLNVSQFATTDTQSIFSNMLSVAVVSILTLLIIKVVHYLASLGKKAVSVVK